MVFSPFSVVIERESFEIQGVEENRRRARKRRRNPWRKRGKSGKRQTRIRSLRGQCSILLLSCFASMVIISPTRSAKKASMHRSKIEATALGTVCTQSFLDRQNFQGQLRQSSCRSAWNTDRFREFSTELELVGRVKLTCKASKLLSHITMFSWSAAPFSRGQASCHGVLVRVKEPTRSKPE